jgi:16S rRNA (guanine966-N2)-methyltransferase
MSSGLRILTGFHKGRKLLMPKGIRPTQDKVRKALFDILGDVADSSFLDLFAGSGAVGLEAWSRGARDVVLVESKLACCSIIQKNIDMLSAAPCRCYCNDALAALIQFHQQKKAFNVVFLDPPYYEEWGKKALQTLEAYDIVPADGLVILQHSKKDKLPGLSGSLIVCKQACYGDTILTIYRKQSTRD